MYNFICKLVDVNLYYKPVGLYSVTIILQSVSFYPGSLYLCIVQFCTSDLCNSIFLYCVTLYLPWSSVLYNSMMLYAPLKLSKFKNCQPEEGGCLVHICMIHIFDLNIFFLKKKENITLCPVCVRLLRANICLSKWSVSQ